MSTETNYNREFVQQCIDAAVVHKKKEEHQEAALLAKKALANLKLFPDSKAIQFKKSKRHEEVADALFKQERFKEAYKEYSMAVQNLYSAKFSPIGCLASSALGVLCLPLLVFNPCGVVCLALGCYERQLP